MKFKDIPYYISQTTDILPSYEYPNSVCLVGNDGNTQYVHSMRTRSLSDILYSSCSSETSLSTIEFDRDGISTVIVFPDGSIKDA